MGDELELFIPAGTAPVPAGRTVMTPTAEQWSIRDFDGSPILQAVLPDGKWLEVSGWCRLTEHTNPSKAVSDLVPPEHVRKLNTSTARFPNHGYGTARGGNPVKLFVSREGANRLVLDSRVPGAQRLKAWLSDDVLTSIEDTGGYIAPRSLTEVDLLDQLEAETQRTIQAIAGWRQERTRADDAEARADAAEDTLQQMRAAGGLTLRKFRKLYFPDVGEKVFLAHCYRKHYLIDQRPCWPDGDRKRDSDGNLIYGEQHNHPGHAGLAWLKLEGKDVHGGKRRFETRVRPDTELDFVARLVKDGLPRYDHPQIGGAA